MYVETVQPQIIVVADQDVKQLTPLGQAIYDRCQGEMLRRKGLPLILCENETQERAWWAEEHRRSWREWEWEATADYMADALRRGVSEDAIYSTIGEW